MIDLEKMSESVGRLRRVFGGETRATQSIGEVYEILQRLISAEKDAERYRWLRDEANNSSGVAPLVLNTNSCGSPISVVIGEHLDCAIDRAMQCK